MYCILAVLTLVRPTRSSVSRPLPPLDTSSLPSPYITLPESRGAGPSKLRDPDVEQARKAAASRSAPDAPPPPPELTKDGKRLTKKEMKKVPLLSSCRCILSLTTVLFLQAKNKTAGPGWFDLPAPAESDLPRLYREVEALRLHKRLDPKQFYRKESGEGKGIKGLPKHFAVRPHTCTCRYSAPTLRLDRHHPPN